MQKNFIEIDNVFINTDILEIKFTCNLTKCKGACCTMESKFSAPLSQSEISEIENILPIVKKYLPENHLHEIEQKGFWEQKEQSLMTRSVNSRDCVFIYYDDDIAKCGIEKAYSEGKIDFIKPLSCHLFPIRVSDFRGPILRYEEYHECKSALKNGLQRNLSLIGFCQDALERSFGKKWFEKVKKFTIS